MLRLPFDRRMALVVVFSCVCFKIDHSSRPIEAGHNITIQISPCTRPPPTSSSFSRCSQ